MLRCAHTFIVYHSLCSCLPEMCHQQYFISNERVKYGNKLSHAGNVTMSGNLPISLNNCLRADFWIHLNMYWLFMSFNHHHYLQQQQLQPWHDDVIKETFSALLTFCEGNPPVTGEFPSQRPVTRSFGAWTTVEQAMETPVIWDTIVLIMAPL